MKSFRLISAFLLISFVITSCSQSSEHPLFDATWKLEEQSFVTAPSLKSSLNNKAFRGIRFLSGQQLLMVGRPTFVANFIYRSDSLYYQPENGQHIHAFHTRLSSEGDTLTFQNDVEKRMYVKLTPPEKDYKLASVTLDGFQYYSKTTPSFSFTLSEDGTASVGKIRARSSISDDPPVVLEPKEIQLDSALLKGILSLGENITFPMQKYHLKPDEMLKIGNQNMTLSYHHNEDQYIEYVSIRDPYWKLFHRSLMSLLVEDRLQHEVFEGNPFF